MGTTPLPARLSKIMGRAFTVALPMPTSTGDGFVVRNPRTVCLARGSSFFLITTPKSI